jgi:hypothetical protein
MDVLSRSSSLAARLAREEQSPPLNHGSKLLLEAMEPKLGETEITEPFALDGWVVVVITSTGIFQQPGWHDLVIKKIDLPKSISLIHSYHSFVRASYLLCS